MTAPGIGSRLGAALLNLRAAAHEVRRALHVANEGDRAELREALSDIYNATTACESIERRHAPSTGATP